MRRILLAAVLLTPLTLPACGLESQARVDSIRLMNEGVKQYKKNNLSGAENALRDAIKRDPTNYHAHDQLGKLLRKTERWADAEQAYRDALSQVKTDANADPVEVARYHYQLGRIIEQLGRAEGATRATFEEKAAGAIGEYDAALKLDTNLYKAHFHIGKLHDELDEPEKADQAYRQCIAINGGFSPAIVSLGTMYIDYGFSNVAMAVLEAGTKANPTDAAAWKGYGEALQNLNRTKEAIDAYKKATKIDPDGADVYFNLGMAYQEQRQKSEAVEALETFLQKGAGKSPPHIVKAANDTIARMQDVI
jgi:tetratricopeptide (TPR) repeat protein